MSEGHGCVCLRTVSPRDADLNRKNAAAMLPAIPATLSTMMVADTERTVFKSHLLPVYLWDASANMRSRILRAM